MIFEGELTKILGLKKNFEYVDYNSSEKAKTDLLDKHSSIDISLEEHSSGYGLIAVDLSRDGCSSEVHFNLDRKGTFELNIELKFSDALSAPIWAVIYNEYDSLLR